jgi:Protein of unknown function (DUF2971)
MTTEDKIKKFDDAFLKLFPGIATDFLQSGYGKDGKIDWQNVQFHIPSNNSNLTKSPYFYESKSLLHFSNIYSLSSILQEKNVRFYNLHNLNDPREFTFASKVFNIKEDLIQDAKDNIFTMSFCEIEILKKSTSEFNMWRLYGDNGKGIGLVFKIINDSKKWEDFHVSKIIYGASERFKFVKLINLLNDLNHNAPRLEVDLGKILAFHKSRLFELEKEVRIIFDKREKRIGMQSKTVSNKDNKQIFPIIKSDLAKLVDNPSNIRYLKLPIFYEGKNDYDDEIPLLKIEQIILGYNFVEQIPEIKKHIEQLCDEQLGYKPKIVQTRLKDYYWDIK